MTKKTTINPDSPKLLYFFGRPLAPLYAGLMASRAALYSKNFFRRHQVRVPVVSVGNLTLGGTGKTPMVIYLARLLADQMKVAVVSRGYRGKARQKVNVVSDGSQIFLDARKAGDEPNLMAHSLPGVAVLTGKKRIKPASYGVDVLGAEVIILDDGFQHLSLRRDLDIVLFKVDTFMGNSRIFPGGDLREPLAALQRASCFVLTCVDEDNQQLAAAQQAALEKRFPSTPAFQASYEPVGLVAQGDQAIPVGSFPCGAFCGLASPRNFQKSLEMAGLDVLFFKAFADHHDYSERQLHSLVDRAKKAGAQALVTTEKDIVKLRGMRLDLPIFALRMEMRVAGDFDMFVRKQLATVAK
ncbi:MAG: tetraacyldisaccharide 4'-kinase [Thermodesulfobacteriota bacterium]